MTTNDVLGVVKDFLMNRLGEKEQEEARGILADLYEDSGDTEMSRCLREKGVRAWEIRFDGDIADEIEQCGGDIEEAMSRSRTDFSTMLEMDLYQRGINFVVEFGDPFGDSHSYSLNEDEVRQLYEKVKTVFPPILEGEEWDYDEEMSDDDF